MVYPRNGHPKVLAMIESFLDESGIHDTAKVCVMGGYWGGKGQWRKFDKLWGGTLEKFGVPLDEFHAKDLVKRTAYFHGWSDDKSLRLQIALAQVIARYKIHPVAQGVPVAEFFKLTLNERRFMTGATLTPEGKLKESGNPNRPYFAPFQQVIRRVLSYAPVGGKAHFFFGLDRPFAQYATGLYSTLKNNGNHLYQDRFGDISFPLAKETPALQAADLMIHFLYLDMLKRVTDGTLYSSPQPSQLMRILISGVQHRDDLVFQDADLMRQTIGKIPIEQRGELLKEDLA